MYKFKVNEAALLWDAVAVTKEESVICIIEETITGDLDVSNSRRIGLNPVLDPQVIADPEHMPAVGPDKSALTLSQVCNCLYHQGFCPRIWVEGDFYPETTPEEMADDITL